MGLSFLNGAFLGALSLVSIPIIIHLLQRRRYQVVRWGAMEFLRLSQKNRSRRLMIEQLLLLLLRCLILALVVLAICRPVVRLAGVPIAGTRGQVHAVIVLDTSYSMGYRPAGATDQTVFDRARKRALDLVQRGLRQGDAVSVILASDPPRALIRKPSLDLKSVVALLSRSVKLSDSGTNYGKAARLALEIVGESSYVNREVFLISDNQASGWEGPTLDRSTWEELSKRARMVMLPVREGPAPNVAVEWVQAARGIATVRSSTRIQANIINRGAQPVRDLLVNLEIDGKSQGPAQRINIEPGQGTLVQFNQIFDRPGVRACTVRVAGDRLAADDVGYLALRVRDSVKVLVLNGKPDPVTPQNDAAFFLQVALSPPLTVPGTEPSALEPRVLNQPGFGNMNVRDYDVLALSNVANLSESDRKLLAEFVQNGGGVLLFLGDRVNPSLYNRDLFEGKPSLLPARIGALDSTKTTLDIATLDHPALQRFKGAQDVDLNTAEFSKHFKLTPAEGDKSVRVMARFTDGSPAMVEKTFGLGKLILVSSTANTQWNSLPLKPAFLPLIHQLVAYLATGADGTRNGRVGEPLVKPLPLSEAGRRVTVSAPSGDRTALKPLVDDRGATVTVEQPARAGFYRLAVDQGTQDLFAVNRNTEESDLRALDQGALKRLIPVSEWTWIGLNENLLGALNQARQGVELWRYLLLGALGLMVMETMLAQIF
ncbi:MAG: N-terminal double-transrane domain, partial [Armatimonadetes bacterium]|nr:N-terminal double-transrane domain [Armatimonadota bacterium]